MIFNKNILKLHRAFAIQNLHNSNFLIEHAANEIIENLELLNIQPQNILELGMRGGHLSRKLAAQYPHSKLTLTEMVESSSASILTSHDELDFEPCSFDLIVSCMNFHWTFEVEKLLRNINKILTEDGKLVINFVASGSLQSLAKFLIECEIEAKVAHRPHIIPLPKEEKVQTIFQATGFKFVVVATEKIELEYESPIKLMKDLKNMGENNALSSGIAALPKCVYTAQKTPFLDIVNLITVVAGK